MTNWFQDWMEREVDQLALETARTAMLEEILELRWGWIVL